MSTHVTHFGNTTSFPVPILNPTQHSDPTISKHSQIHSEHIHTIMALSAIDMLTKGKIIPMDLINHH